MVGEVTDKKSHVSNAGLLAILGVLIILIIALIVGVVVHNTINNGSPLAGGDNSQTGGGASGGSGGGNGSEGSAVSVNMAGKFDDTEDVDSLVEIRSAINDVFAETGDVDATIAKYEEAIAAAQEKGQQGMEYELYLDNAEFMVKNDRCDDAMEYLNAKDLEGASTQFQTRYFSAGVGMSIECKNTTEQASWQSKLDYAISLSSEGVGW